jgi:DNA-binding NtrC family response regulator
MPKDLVESQLFGHRKGAFTGATSDAEGMFRAARGGTLFLDEIGEFPLDLQPKLLRVLESREFLPVGDTRGLKTDARVVAATNVDIQSAIQDGRFRADLYARLAAYTIRLPVLSERRSDIPLLIRSFLASLGRKCNWTTAFLERMLLYGWPLNIRELRSVVHRLTLLGEPLLDAQHLDGVLDSRAASPPSRLSSDTGRRPSREELIAALEACDGNVTRVAERYGKNPTQVYRWLKHYGVDPTAYRRQRVEIV